VCNIDQHIAEHKNPPYQDAKTVKQKASLNETRMGFKDKE